MKIKFVLLIAVIGFVNAYALHAAAFNDNKMLAERTRAVLINDFIAFQDTDLNVMFPKRLGTFKFHGRHQFPENGSGYALSYDDNKLFKIHVYVYDNNISNIGDSINSKEITEEFNTVLNAFSEMEKMGLYKNAKQLNKGTASFLKGGQHFLWSRNQHSQLPQEGDAYVGERISDTYLTAKSGKFIKVRITFIAEEFKKKQKDEKEFMEALSKILEQ